MNTITDVSNSSITDPSKPSTIDFAWTVEHEHILAEWADKAMCYRWLHASAHSHFSFLNALYTVPCIIISTLAGTANFAQARVPPEYQALFAMFVGGINILGGIISTIQQFLKITQLNEAHRVASISWDKFYRNIKIELAKHPDERIHVSQMLKMSKEEFDRLMETSPDIPDKIINQFKHNFKDSADYDKIAKPEICDVLIATENFRNPWFNEENQEKRATSLVQMNNALEQKKKSIKQHNIENIQTFKKNFIALHNREPLDNEIITNLEDSLDKDVLKELLTELSSVNYNKV
jgi:hypothetical protein